MIWRGDSCRRALGGLATGTVARVASADEHVALYHQPQKKGLPEGSPMIGQNPIGLSVLVDRNRIEFLTFRSVRVAQQNTGLAGTKVAEISDLQRDAR